jgi:hypothetical protein
MKIEHSFVIPITEAALRERTITFMVQAGYKLLPDSSGGILLFQRGTTWGVLTSFDPKRWKCTLSVEIKPEDASSAVNIEAKIAADPTEKHFAEELLTAEFSLVETALTTNELRSFDTGGLKKKVAGHVYRIVLIFAAMMISAVLGVIAGAFSSFSLNITIWGAAAIGAGFMIIMGALFAVILRGQKKA